MKENKIYLIAIIILLSVCVIEAGVITALPKTRFETVMVTKIETEVVKPDAIWVTERTENNTLFCDIYRYNESYDIYFKLTDEYDFEYSWISGLDSGIIYTIRDYSNIYNTWGTLIDSVEILSPNYWNIGEDGYLFESVREMNG